MADNIYHTAEELAQDLKFIEWVNAGQSPEKRMHWINAVKGSDNLIEEALAIVQASTEEHSYSSDRQSRLFDRIQNSINEESNKSGKGIRWLYIVSSSVAACLLVLWFFRTPGQINIETNMAQTETVLLPEGSRIIVNAVSDIEYNKRSFSLNREIHLKGEAFFEVEKGESFVVKTDYGTVEVLGTSFNVFARDNQFEVSCHSGSVKVSSPDLSSSVILTPGEECILKNGQIELVDRSYVEKEWTEGTFHFENTPLSNVMQEVERQFDISIELSAKIKDTNYTGFFENNAIDSAFNSILWPLNLQVVQKSKSTYLVIPKK